MADSGQKFISRNRSPRVHISYDVETYGARKSVELPFVMGVMSDLSGKSEVAKKDLKDREFSEFDIDNFDKRMAAISPRAAFLVDNEIEGEGKLGVDLTFKKMDDFEPGKIAQNVPALAKLLEARQQLNDLLIMMDGKQNATELLDKVLKDENLLKALSEAKAKSEAEGEATADAAETEE
ncbi:type VI secretion system contractile sheath small subunit [Erythrobacter sp. JK5]|uniref:type VI secretion system contractile sheath small subunit n=1 Tax=Erythrobacter sp. JK5 TaxID=2829500 RepID=UPI001BA647B0|nr:type VI secretion system contractile sheath small subunit [Erythrobacter sp. JK5]QUL36775.1 type VI secretion system contractile sheath small subunit [Erythrobacter sp. JK5]